MGTPQVRCREMHQSGRDSTADLMRLTPQSGTHLTSSMASIAISRNEAVGQWLRIAFNSAGGAFLSEAATKSSICLWTSDPRTVGLGMTWSILMNHWSIARKMMGVLLRQQCG